VIVQAVTIVPGENHLGRVTDGGLTLTGKVQHMASLGHSEPYPGTWPLDDYYEMVSNGKVICDSRVWFDWSSPCDVLDHLREHGVWLLLLASYRAEDSQRLTSNLVSSGLVLVPVDREGDTVRKFRRVGMFLVLKEAGEPIFQSSPIETITII